MLDEETSVLINLLWEDYKEIRICFYCVRGHYMYLEHTTNKYAIAGTPKVVNLYSYRPKLRRLKLQKIYENMQINQTS
jgi:hypothetical protein